MAFLQRSVEAVTDLQRRIVKAEWKQAFLLEAVISDSWIGWNIGFIGGGLGISGEWGPVSKRSSKDRLGFLGE